MSIREEQKKKLGFGTMRLPVKRDGSIDYETYSAMADRFIAKGFCYFDTAYPYHDGQSEIALRECVVKRHKRSEFTVADKMPQWSLKTSEDLERIFTEQLEKCGLEYFDFYLLHNMNKDTYAICQKVDGFAFLRKIKADGRAKHIGFSFHDTPELLDEILGLHPEVEFVQLQINYFDWESDSIQSRKCYEVAVKHGVEVVVMEPVKGGSLANLKGKAEEMLPKDGSNASYAIRFAATLPQVFMVLSGMSTPEQMEDNTSYMENFVPLKDEEVKLLLDVAEELRKIELIPCTDCRYCMENCPMNIAIPRIFRMVNQQRQFNLYADVKARYAKITDGFGKASECLHCGVCEMHCPQHIEIRSLLEKAAEEFE